MTPTEPDGGILKSLPEEWSQARERQILGYILQGLEDPISFAEVVSKGQPGTPREGYELRIPVMDDAMKFEGVRIEGTFETGQRVADWLGLTLMTPYVAGLISEQADAPIAPTTLSPTTAKKSQMVEASREVDARLDAFPNARLKRNTGKYWVLTIRYTEAAPHPASGVAKLDAGANHGLFTKAWEPIQNVGTFHRYDDHTDYSQMLRYIGETATLIRPDGTSERVPTKTLVTDAFLAPLVTGEKGRLRGKQVGEGALPYDRHPSIPYEPPPQVVA